MSFFSLFKKPSPSIAFSFDGGMLRHVCVSRHDGMVVVDHFGSADLSGMLSGSDAVVDEGKFVAHLRGLAANKKIESANVIIPDAYAVCFHTHVARAPERQMSDVIVDHIKTYCEARDLLAYAEYISEYEIILETQFGYDIHVTLVPKLYVAHLVRLFKQAGITVPHIETAHHAVARSCVNVPNGTGYVAVSIGRNKTAVSIINGEHLVSHDVVSVGVENLYRTVEKYLDVSRADAERIIAKHGMLGTHPDNGLLAELYLEMSAIWRSVDRQLVALGQMPYKTYGYRFVTNDLLAYGEGISIRGLVAYLGTHTNLHARELDVWSGHHDDRAPIQNIPASETPKYAEALSLALLYLVPSRGIEPRITA